MAQSFSDKCAAIESLLGWVYAHLDFIPAAARTQRQQWVSEPSPLDEPAPPPVAFNLECRGHCQTCLAYAKAHGLKVQCPPDEQWRREFSRVRREYRITDVTRALLELADVDVHQAQAVWAVYVEPWPGDLVDGTRPSLGTRTEAISWPTRLQRADLAEQGIVWMAHKIRGDVRAYGERVDPRDNEIRRMIADEIPRRLIAKKLRCSLRDVQRVAAAEMSAGRG